MTDRRDDEVDELARTGEVIHDPMEHALDQLRARDDIGVRDMEVARAVLESVAVQLARHGRPPGRADTIRLAQLETWRAEVDAWRLRLTGVDEANGRLGKLTRSIEGLREDVGTSEQAATTRAIAVNVKAWRKRTVAALGAAALAIGGAGYKFLIARDASVAAAARAAGRLELRLDHVEARLDRHDRVLLRSPRRDATPDPEPDPRIP